MEDREYASLRAQEDGHWWYRGLRDLVAGRLTRAERVLDAGCGTGGMMARLEGGRPYGVDVSPLALRLCRERGLATVAAGSVTDLPFAEGSFDAVLSLDVLYHRRVEDDLRALREATRVLRPGGRLFLHLPAYPRLAGSHDRAVHGARRYTAPRVRELVSGAGLEVVELTYRNAAALVGALLLRPFSRPGDRGRGAPPRSDLRPLPGLLNGLLCRLAAFENAIIKRAPLPAGLSVWCVGRKPG